MSKKKPFTVKQAKYLGDVLESLGWVVYPESLECPVCAETAEADWSYCANCGNDFDKNPATQDEDKIAETLSDLVDAVNEAMEQ